MRACGWEVLEVVDGTQDVEKIVATLLQAKASREKPTFINIRTVIGIGSQVAGNAKAHGAAYGVEDVKSIKKAFGMNPEEHFILADEVYSYFREAKGRGDAIEKDWSGLLAAYRKEYPELHKDFTARVEGKFPKDWKSIIPAKGSFSKDPIATRKSAGLIGNPLADALNNFMVGTADLSPSVAMIWKDKVDFQHVRLSTLFSKIDQLISVMTA